MPRSPSTTLSLRQTCETSDAAELRVDHGPTGASTGEPVLWLVTSTCRVVLSSTGWLMPRCPLTQLVRPKPSARPRIWLPKQMPKQRLAQPHHLAGQRDRPVGVAGSPGRARGDRVGTDREQVLDRRRGRKMCVGHAARAAGARRALDAQVERATV